MNIVIEKNGTREYVLIETLWNVNTIIPSNENRPNGVLIETLWNVNNSNSSISGRTTEY